MWKKCLGIDFRGFWSKLKDKSNKPLRTAFSWLIVLTLFMLLPIVGVTIKSATMTIFSLTGLLAASIAFFVYSSRLYEKDPLERHRSLQDRASKEVLTFLRLSGIPCDRLPAVLSSIKEYRAERLKDREIFVNRAFSFLVCGVFIFALNNATRYFVEENNEIWAVFAIIGIFTLGIAAIAPTAWKVKDQLQAASLTNTNAMIRNLECWLNSKSTRTK